MKHVLTDGGKPENLDERDLDCTVRSLAIAGRIDYELAYILFEDWGRKPGEACSGLVSQQAFRAYNSNGFGSVYTVEDRYLTIAQFVKANPKGRFIIRYVRSGAKCGHVFAVVDGVVHDNFRPHGGLRFNMAWKVVPKGE